MAGKRQIELAQAIALADEIRKRVARAEGSIAELTHQLRTDAIELKRLSRLIASLKQGEPPSAASERPKNPDRRDVTDKALQIVREAARPLSRRDLFERLAGRGVVISGKDPEMVLGTMLYRDDRIVRLRGHGYWPRDEVYEPAFYIPEHESVIGATESKNPATK